MSHYSEIRTISLPDWRIARYVIISPNPEDDVNAYMENWAKASGLLDYQGYTPKRIGWDFPHLSMEQMEKYHLRGYVSAYVIPEDFTPMCKGAEITILKADTYAMITIKDPFKNPFIVIPKAYQHLMEYAKKNHCQPTNWDERLAFEEVYEKDGITYMDVYTPIN